MSVLVWAWTASVLRYWVCVPFAMYPILPWPRQDISSLPLEASSRKLSFTSSGHETLPCVEWEPGHIPYLRMSCSNKANITPPSITEPSLLPLNSWQQRLQRQQRESALTVGTGSLDWLCYLLLIASCSMTSCSSWDSACPVASKPFQ